MLVTDEDVKVKLLQILTFSGNCYPEHVTHALNADASGLISKPFSKDCAFERQKHHG